MTEEKRWIITMRTARVLAGDNGAITGDGSWEVEGFDFDSREREGGVFMLVRVM